MTKPMIRIHNTETNEIIDREMTNAEIAQNEKNREAEVAEAEARAAVKAAAQAKLAALGLTVEDLQALGL